MNLNLVLNAQNKSSKPGVIIKGWLKYIVITPSKKDQNFEENPEFDFYEKTLKPVDHDKMDDVGFIDIPDKHSFYFVMTQDSLNILSSRRDQITKTVDVVDLNAVKRIDQAVDKEGNLEQRGGLSVLGLFDEGKCFKLDLRTGQAQIFCSVSVGKIDQMMDIVWRKFKAKMEEKPNPLEDEATAERNFMIDDNKFDMEAQIHDELTGKHANELADIGDWSVCDHVCGGGVQTKQKGCKPPLSGHKCTQKPMKLKKACNTQPCKAGESGAKIEVPDESWKFMQPTITLPVTLEARQISHRQQQYEECKIKDEDLCIRRQDLKQKLNIKMAPILPGRGVLNKKTFSFQDNTKQDSLHRSQLLQDIVVKPFALDTNCFEVKSTNDVKDSLVLCGCPFEPSSRDAAVIWVQEIIKFRDNCPDNEGGISVNDNDKLKLSYGSEQVEVSGAKLKELGKSALEDKEKDKEREEEEREEQKISDAINEVETITTNQTKNEFFKEKLIEKESELKAKKELESLDKLIQKEKEKEKCIQTFLDRESRKQARIAKEKNAEKELTQIKKEVENQVKEIKHVFRNKMGSLQKETERIKMEKMKQLTNMKLRITSMLIDQESKGSISNCKQDKEENKLAQCNARFPTTWFENKFCRVKENFCGVCCEKEFSVRFAEDREKCLQECRLVNGMISMGGGSEKLTGTNEIATVEIVNNP